LASIRSLRIERWKASSRGAFRLPDLRTDFAQARRSLEGARSGAKRMIERTLPDEAARKTLVRAAVIQALRRMR